MAAALVDQLGDVGLGQAFVFGQAVIGPGFFDRIEVFALEVFDQGQRGHLALAQIADNRWNFMKLRTLGGPPAALPGDQTPASRTIRGDDH